jgi:hypothetical protein
MSGKTSFINNCREIFELIYRNKLVDGFSYNDILLSSNILIIIF